MGPGGILKTDNLKKRESTKEEQKRSSEIVISSAENSDFELSLKIRNTAEVKSDDYLHVDNENSKTESSSNVGFET